jgi:hypothetical protein
MKIAENEHAEKKERKDMTIDEIISLLADVRTELKLLRYRLGSDELREELKQSIRGIDIVGCELTQNIAKLLKEKENKKN